MSSFARSNAWLPPALAAALVALIAVPAAFALPGGEWKERLAKGIESDDTRVRTDAIKGVDPSDRSAVPALFSVIAKREANRVDGHIRAVVIEKLAEVKEPKLVEAIAKMLVSKDALQREAAALALGKQKATAHTAAIGKLLDDKDPAVRRAAMKALGATGDLAGVDLLVKRWEKLAKEKGPLDMREVVTLEGALVTLTEAALPREPGAWREFWDKSAQGFKRPSEWTEEEKKAAAEARKKAEEEGRTSVREEAKTTLREIPLDYSVTGKGPIPLLVIHDDSWLPKYFEPYLAGLEDICKIYIVELPSITKLQIKKRNIGGWPFWPYDELCDAFDELRKQGKHQKFAILAHGFSTMIAMRYLSKYGENVSHAIMVGAFPGDDAYGNMLDKLSAKATGQMKDKELDNAIKFHFVNDEKTFKRFYDPKSNEELEVLDRKFFTIMFANPQDPEIADIWLRCRKPSSLDLKAMEKEQCQSPPFDILREKKPDVPVLVISGAKSIWFGPADGERVAKNYPKGTHVVLQNSSMMPWFEENAAFNAAVKDFFAKNPYAGTGKK